MKRKIFFLLFLIFPLLLTACTNPQGGIGPSWDVTARIPLLKGNEENKLTVYDLFGENFNPEGAITVTLADGDITLFDLGTKMSTISITDNEIKIPIVQQLPEFNPELSEFAKINFGISFSNLILGKNQIPFEISGENVDIDSISFSIFVDGFSRHKYVVSVGTDGSGLLELDNYVNYSSDNVFIAAEYPNIDENSETELILKFPEKLYIESITCDVNEYLGDNEIDTKIDFEIELNIDEKTMEKVDFNADLVINLQTLDGMEIDLENLTFTIMGNKTDVFVAELRDLDDTGTRKTIEFKDGKDILDIILDPEIKGLKVSGDYIISGEEVTITYDSKVGIESVEVQIPFDIAVEDDLVFTTNVVKLEPVDEDIRELLKHDLEGAFVVEGLHNKFGMSLIMELYIASIPGNRTDEELEEILYKSENMIKRASIQKMKEYNVPYTVKVDAEELDIFFEDNLYAGIKFIVPANEEGERYKITGEDELTFDRMYISITGKINK